MEEYNLVYLLDGKLYHWSSIFLDYLFAFGVIGLAGVFKSFVEKSSNKLSIEEWKNI